MSLGAEAHRGRCTAARASRGGWSPCSPRPRCPGACLQVGLNDNDDGVSVARKFESSPGGAQQAANCKPAGRHQRGAHSPVVALDSSDARMPRPRCEMYLAVARSSSAYGLAALCTKAAVVTVRDARRGAAAEAKGRRGAGPHGAVATHSLKDLITV